MAANLWLKTTGMYSFTAVAGGGLKPEVARAVLKGGTGRGQGGPPCLAPAAGGSRARGCAHWSLPPSPHGLSLCLTSLSAL